MDDKTRIHNMLSIMQDYYNETNEKNGHILPFRIIGIRAIIDDALK